MTVEELLKSKGIAEDVITGLPKEVIGHLTGYVSEADTKLQTATEAARTAEEARRQAELEKQEIDKYVTDYGTSLTKMSSVEAKNAAYVEYLKKLKAQGFEVPEELMAGEPDKKSTRAEGGILDESQILGKVGVVMSQWMDANNEHIRLFGVPIPDDSTTLNMEATRARKPLGEYAAEKYKYRETRQAKAKAEEDKRVEERAQARLTELRQKEAEERGSNPNLRSGESSRASLVKPIKSEEFHKSDGRVPRRQRLGRMLDRIHAETAEAQSA